ncbi:hypothetical protein F5Y17DRAFT_450521 [Xylariaceae sp. FL0594]|nr:hypothetical protein F5Y17DRAFT_450521 [Xylariaceae sp. FL0594]
MALVQLTEEREREIVDLQERLMRSILDKSKLWELEKVLGNGTFGVTMLITNRDPLHIHKRRRLVLKRSLLMNDVYRNEELIKESHSLQRMRGNAHHLQMIASSEEVNYYRRKVSFESPQLPWWRRLLGAFKNPPKNLIRSISHLDGPAVLLEYMENGDLLTMWERIWRAGVPIPNRLLWKIYLCMIRAVIGMAYPPGGPPGAPTKIEQLPQDNKEPGRFTHNDIALRNVMIGGRWLNDSEHKVIPIFKVIDYGMSSYSRTPEEAIHRNLAAVARTMIWMLGGPDAGNLIGQLTQTDDYHTIANGLVNPDDWPNLDNDLRELLMESLALEDFMRPGLREAYNRVLRGASKPPEVFAGRQIEESNIFIDEFLDRYLFHAST